MLAVCLAWYFAYVLLAGYAHDFMATPVFGSVNVGMLLGLAQFVTTFAMTTWYVRYANRSSTRSPRRSARSSSRLRPTAEEVAR